MTTLYQVFTDSEEDIEGRRYMPTLAEAKWLRRVLRTDYADRYDTEPPKRLGEIEPCVVQRLLPPRDLFCAMLNRVGWAEPTTTTGEPHA